MSKRKRVRPEEETQVLVASARRCCLCFGLEGDFSQKTGQIAHLDHDPNNSNLDNLAYLCLDHHDQYDSRTSQSKGLTIKEVKHYRVLLYQTVKESLRASESGQCEAVTHKEPGRLHFLSRIRTGKELAAIAGDADSYRFDNDEPDTEEEMELISNFFEHVVDFCEDLGSRGPGTPISTAFWFNSRIEQLEQNGFKVFGRRERKRMKVGDIFDVRDTAILTVIRATNSMIINVDAVRESVEQMMADDSVA